MRTSIGRLQLDYLVSQGLRPEHYLLDVGCGPLRAGRFFIGYLEPGHYFGVDRNGERLRRGFEERLDADAQARQPTLVCMDDFGFERLGRKFDVALAQSVFTHLPLNDIMRCLVSVSLVLAPEGRFYATFFENPSGKRHLEPVRQARGDIVTHYDKDPYHYDLDTLACACRGTGLAMEYVGDWGHARNQMMLVFRRAG
jgi:SAM-dependent methyltransferase